MNFSAGLKGVIVIEGHVQGLSNTRTLGKAGIPVIVVSEYDCLARYSKYCNKFFRCPAYLSNEFIDFLIRLAKNEEIRDWILLPSNDHAVYNISSHLRELQPYFKVISPEPGILDTVYDKEKLVNMCRSSEIQVPESWFPENQEWIKNSALRYPLLIKGKNGLTFYKNTGKKAFLVKNTEQLESAVNTILDKMPFGEIYFQDLVPIENNKPVSFTAFSISGEIKAYWMGRKIREHPVSFGTATYSRSTLIPELLPPAEKLIRKLGYTGVCEIEFMLDPRDQTYRLIEVNARTWLWVNLAIKSGINYPLMIYNYLNNIEMDYPHTYSDDKEWLHYLTDIPYSFLGLVRGYYSLNEIISSYSQLPAPAVFETSDILPSLAELLLLPLLIINR